jgi:hypothetical protein
MTNLAHEAPGVALIGEILQYGVGLGVLVSCSWHIHHETSVIMKNTGT